VRWRLKLRAQSHYFCAVLQPDQNYCRLRIGFMYKRTTVQTKKKDIITNFLQFVDHTQHPIPVHNLLDTEVPEDAALLEHLKQHVADQSEEFQGMSLQLGLWVLRGF
jgi:hypothetical protein